MLSKKCADIPSRRSTVCDGGKNSAAIRDESTASTLRVPEDTSIIPCHLLNCSDQTTIRRICWYNWWIRHQIQEQPRELFLSMPNNNPVLTNDWLDSFMILWKEVWNKLTTDPSWTIDAIVKHLCASGFLYGDSLKHVDSAVNLVFAILGWQTMLYRPDMLSCSAAQLAIADETDGYLGQAQFVARQSQLNCKRSLPEFLLGFGVLLPPRNFKAILDDTDKSALKQLKTVGASSLNAHILMSIGGTTIKWTDCLSRHLEFDTSSNKLYLFRYPSFCITNLESDMSNCQPRTSIHACAAPVRSDLPWATAEDVSRMLREVLLSYRLLFGQEKASRRAFRDLDPFNSIPDDGADKLLWELCSRKKLQFDIKLKEREIYDLSRDFPILGSRIGVVVYYLMTKKPRTWKELWRDKRDSASWFTFWAVLIVGGVGLLLAFIQVILQIIQVSLQMKQTS